MLLSLIFWRLLSVKPSKCPCYRENFLRCLRPSNAWEALSESILKSIVAVTIVVTVTTIVIIETIVVSIVTTIVIIETITIVPIVELVTTIISIVLEIIVVVSNFWDAIFIQKMLSQKIHKIGQYFTLLASTLRGLACTSKATIVIKAASICGVNFILELDWIYCCFALLVGWYFM